MHVFVTVGVHDMLKETQSQRSTTTQTAMMSLLSFPRPTTDGNSQRQCFELQYKHIEYH